MTHWIKKTYTLINYGYLVVISIYGQVHFKMENMFRIYVWCVFHLYEIRLFSCTSYIVLLQALHQRNIYIYSLYCTNARPFTLNNFCPSYCLFWSINESSYYISFHRLVTRRTDVTSSELASWRVFLRQLIKAAIAPCSHVTAEIIII